MTVKFGNKKIGGGGASASGKGVPSFMKKGQAAAKAMEEQQKKDEKKRSGVWRFWMPNDSETQVTFLDGNLDEDGMLDCPMWYEHQLQIAGDWKNWFVCVKEEEPCPLCNINESRLVAGFTIIDHTAFESKKSGIIQDTIKLYIPKQETLKMLQKIATKRGGLAGATFDVSRTGENSAAVGNMFDFEQKRSLKELQKAYGSQDKIIAPLDYGEVIEYKSAEQLIAEGFGEKPVGSEANYNDKL